jgi:hypothetical protein
MQCSFVVVLFCFAAAAAVNHYAVYASPCGCLMFRYNAANALQWTGMHDIR